jgi:hypothetical protein
MNLLVIKTGLGIRFDSPPDLRALNGGSFIVTLESFSKDTTNMAGLRDVFVLEGTTQVNTADPLLVVWPPHSCVGGNAPFLSGCGCRSGGSRARTAARTEAVESEGGAGYISRRSSLRAAGFANGQQPTH